MCLQQPWNDLGHVLGVTVSVCGRKFRSRFREQFFSGGLGTRSFRTKTQRSTAKLSRNTATVADIAVPQKHFPWTVP